LITKISSQGSFWTYLKPDHSILLKELEFYGLAGIALDWVNCYLTNTLQEVQVNIGKTSCKGGHVCGVLQGSIFGPLFFILYVNDLPNCIGDAEYLFFADDTSTFYQNQNPKIL